LPVAIYLFVLNSNDSVAAMTIKYSSKGNSTSISSSSEADGISKCNWNIPEGNSDDAICTPTNLFAFANA
jgi:hypothetical protein